MIENKYISKEKINIKVVLKPDSNKDFFDAVFTYIQNYLNINVVYIENFLIEKAEEILNLENEKVDYLFVDFIKEYEYVFAWNFYSKMHKINNNFKLILFKNKISTEDIKYFKNGADEIIYLSDDYYEDKEKYIKWKIFSILRRRWDFARSNYVLIRNGVIVDLLKRKVIINNKEINITKKEFEVLQILIEEFNKRNNFISKRKLFKKIYGIENSDNSRVIDQIIFRIKNKFPDSFLELDKRKGIKIR